MNDLTAEQFARLCVQLDHKPADIEKTVRERYPDVDAVRVVEEALSWHERANRDARGERKQE